ncbi:MAG: hypothetical protein P9L92_15635 [Candidatus Electryonea clarkiae]|nr:hypothetical protein [Candidatus Electryonea clarkiae]MDP8285552.1 hypothetical protein [Candidatus Electryonea clarkiae]
MEFNLYFKRFLILLFLPCTLIAGEVQTTVKYLSNTAIYLDAGRAQGINKGDLGEVRRDNQKIASIKILFVADNSSSCKIIEKSGEIQLGDVAIISVHEEIIPSQEIDTFQVAEKLPPRITRIRTKSIKANQLSGRIGLQYYFQDDQSDFDNDVHQPSLAIKNSIQNLFGSNHQLNLNMRIRQFIKDRNDPDRARTEWNNRIYEVSLTNTDPANPLHYKAGRVISNRISGIGKFDGALVDYQINDKITMGAFGGTHPDLRNTQISTDEVKTGAYVHYESDINQKSDIGGTVALAGRYNKGNISKEFIYEQVMVSYNRKLSFYQSADLEINRAWRKEVSGSSMQLSNLLLNGRYSISRSVSLNAGYSNNTLVRTYESRETPDSLFDDTQRQGFRLGINAMLPYRIRTNARIGVRLRGVDNSSTSTQYFSIGKNDLFSSGIGIRLNLNLFDNPRTSGTQPNLHLSRLFFHRLRSSVQFGLSSYTMKDYEGSVSYNWIKTGIDYYFNSPIYISSFFEAYRGDNLNLNRIFIEIGMRY